MVAGGEKVEALGPPGAEDWGQRHLGIGTLVGAGSCADLPADHQVAPAAFGGVVVRRHFRLSHADEEFLDVVLHASAQPGRDGRRVIPVGTAEGQQALLKGKLGGVMLFRGAMCKGCGLAVEMVDGVSPLVQSGILGAEDAQVVDIPQQVGPAALFGAAIGQGLGWW